MAVKLVSTLRIPKEWDLGKRNGGISQSLLGNYQTCPRRFLFQVNRWYDPKKERNMAYGSMVHEVLDQLYTSFFKTKQAKLADLPDVVLKGIDKYELPAVLTGDEQEQAKAVGEAILLAYTKYYTRDFRELRFEQVERTFCVKYGQFYLRGKVDGRFRDRTGGVWHIEHKNYSRINEETITLKLAFDLQNLLYLLADRMENNRQLHGVLYNILRRPEVRKEMLTGDLRKHVAKAIAARPAYYFLRWEIPYTVLDLDAFDRELTEKLLELQARCAKCSGGGTGDTLQIFWKNECACELPYSCEFLNACASGHLTGYRQKPVLFTELA